MHGSDILEFECDLWGSIHNTMEIVGIYEIPGEIVYWDRNIIMKLIVWRYLQVACFVN